MENLPVGIPIEDAGIEDVGIPVDEHGNSLIPELQHRDPTRNERFLIGGGILTAASTNVKEFWWNWRNKNLFVRFLDNSLYVYVGVSLAVAVGFIETDSPGRYVWNHLRDRYPYQRLSGRAATDKRPRSQVVRLIHWLVGR